MTVLGIRTRFPRQTPQSRTSSQTLRLAMTLSCRLLLLRPSHPLCLHSCTSNALQWNGKKWLPPDAEAPDRLITLILSNRARDLVGQHSDSGLDITDICPHFDSVWFPTDCQARTCTSSCMASLQLFALEPGMLSSCPISTSEALRVDQTRRKSSPCTTTAMDLSGHGNRLPHVPPVLSLLQHLRMSCLRTGRCFASPAHALLEHLHHVSVSLLTSRCMNWYSWCFPAAILHCPFANNSGLSSGQKCIATCRLLMFGFSPDQLHLVSLHRFSSAHSSADIHLLVVVDLSFQGLLYQTRIHLLSIDVVLVNFDAIDAQIPLVATPVLGCLFLGSLAHR